MRASPPAAAPDQAAVKEVQPSAQTDDALEVLRELVELQDCDAALAAWARGAGPLPSTEQRVSTARRWPSAWDRARKLVNGGAA